ncbi:MAG: DUF1122 family protein [Dehalococcoidia bacterium]|nr:DUF1122 family protein [Dehalococcoidia bacterium]MDW8119983.1 DUF1122 family protein [Chloroflexota bacterium]
MADQTGTQASSPSALPPEKALTAAEALLTLDGRPFLGGRLRVEVGPTNRVGAHYFRLWWLTPSGEPTHPPLVEGLHHRGSYPATNWVEVMTLPSVVEGAGVRLALEGEALVALLRLLRALLPPGGHIMVEYEAPHRADTRRALERGTPPEATPLGQALLQAGFTGGFRDWYFAEGWAEGPRKLQAFLPFTKR